MKFMSERVLQILEQPMFISQRNRLYLLDKKHRAEYEKMANRHRRETKKLQKEIYREINPKGLFAKDML